MSADIAPIGASPNQRCSHVHVRLDARRDTRMFVTRNIDGHVHLTIGNEATLILHPHAATRLVANLRAVLSEEEFSAA